MSAWISLVQRFSIGDGPGIRSTVFFKGCSLCCAWCHNPECISFEPEPMHSARLCARCAACARACPNGALSFAEGGAMRVDPAKCRRCFRCAQACPTGALKPDSALMDEAALLALLLKDLDYYLRSGGGVTFSGGEPLLSLDFIETIAPELKQRGVHLAAETAGHVGGAIFLRALNLFDLLMMDVKLADSARHRQYTGHGNERILSNLALTRASETPLLVRIPLVAGVNDDQQNIDATIELLRGHPVLTGVELLKYHVMGLDKAEQLVWTSPQRAFAPPTDEKMQWIAERFEQAGIRVLTD